MSFVYICEKIDCVITALHCINTILRYVKGTQIIIRRHKNTGETVRWLQLQPSSSWPRRSKCSNKFSLCTTQITHTIILGCIWILDFHFKIVLVLRQCCFIPIRHNDDKRKICPWRWLHHFHFQHWRWLHALMMLTFAPVPTGNFWYTHSKSATDKDAYRLYDYCRVWFVSEQNTHFQKEHIFQ